MASKEYEVLMQALLKAVQEASKENAASNATGVPVGISNRHIHLSQADLDQLFGAGYQLTPMKELSQPGQFACKETVTICGPKGAIEKVRVLGPVRKETQIEIVAGDCFKLGVKAPAKLSGDLAGTGHHRRRSKRICADGAGAHRRSASYPHGASRRAGLRRAGWADRQDPRGWIARRHL